ncbi:unnamed protein product [Ceutorhynchus assimilis]|uniref:Uncharacterized protein n=1 Tax=Ceutorhynchus assimilis TaxID=467358 RepID=A0A9P0DGG3_9CUCU|nr:unnamed protein product [Ceutorhynchus assimilis]
MFVVYFTWWCPPQTQTSCPSFLFGPGPSIQASPCRFIRKRMCLIYRNMRLTGLCPKCPRECKKKRNVSITCSEQYVQDLSSLHQKSPRCQSANSLILPTTSSLGSLFICNMLGRREKRQYKKRKHKSRAVEGLSSDEESSLGAPPIEPTPEPDQKDEGPYIFKRKKQVNYHYGGPLGKCSSRLEKGVEDQYFMTSLSNRRPVGFVRKRMGRGGRVILDRPGANDDFWRGLNYTIREPNMNGALTEDDSITNKKLGTEIVEYNKDWAQKQRVPHHSGYSDSITDIKSQIKSDIKSEMELEIKSDVENPLEPTNFNNLIAKGFNIDNKETVELSPSLPRSLYHFRPKTPPPGSDRPCQLLQPDSNFIEPFQMEIQHLLPLSDAVVDHSPFLTDEIDLQTRWLDKGPQGPIFEDYVYEEQKKKKVDSFTSSRVSIYDASGEIPQPEDDELMEVNDELDSTEEEEIETTDEDEAEIGVVEAAVDEDRVYSPRNGQMPKLGFEADGKLILRFFALKSSLDLLNFKSPYHFQKISISRDFPLSCVEVFFLTLYAYS